VILDIYSPYAPGWMLATRDSAALAEKLIADTCTKQNIDRDQLSLHADRGSSMTSKPVACLLADLVVTQSAFTPTRLQRLRVCVYRLGSSLTLLTTGPSGAVGLICRLAPKPMHPLPAWRVVTSRAWPLQACRTTSVPDARHRMQSEGASFFRKRCEAQVAMGRGSTPVLTAWDRVHRRRYQWTPFWPVPRSRGRGSR